MKTVSQFHSPDEVQFLVRDGDNFTAVVLSHFGTLSIPLHADQARLLMADAGEGQVAGHSKHAGRCIVTFKPCNRLLAAANPPEYGEPTELIALIPLPLAGYLAWQAGQGASFRWISDHEANQVLRRARGFHCATQPVLLRQVPYLFACKRSTGVENDLAMTFLPDDTPAEFDALPADSAEIEEALAVFGRKLLHGRLSQMWAGGAL